MSAKIKTSKGIAQLGDDRRWSADDAGFADQLNEWQELVPTTPDIPNVDYASAQFMIDQLGDGEILEFTPAEYDPDTVY